jgi:hypothetical protein
LSVRGFARQLAGGKTATDDQMERERRMVNRLLADERVSDLNAARVAKALRLPAGSFVTPKAESAARLRRERNDLRRHLATLARQVDLLAQTIESNREALEHRIVLLETRLRGRRSGRSE